MKKIVLCCALGFIFWSAAWGQVEPAQTPAPRYEAPVSRYIYCELVASSGAPAYRTAVSIDFGQEVNFRDYTLLRDSKGEIRGFNSMIDAMNFLAIDGWEFVQAYVTISGGEGEKAVSSQVHWLLRLDAGRLSAERKAEILRNLNTEKPEKQKRDKQKNDKK